MTEIKKNCKSTVYMEMMDLLAKMHSMMFCSLVNI